MYLEKMDSKKGEGREKANNGKRNLLTEIEAIKHRRVTMTYFTHPLVNTWQAATYQLEELQKSFEWAAKEGNYDGELLKYIPVGLVATLEAFFRSVISQLIDFGSPYIERVGKLETVRFDVDYIVTLPQKRVSVGEFVSHQLKINNLGNIVKHMSVLLEQDFWNSLKNVVDTESKELFLQNPDVTYQNIVRLFEMRHVIAHEMNFYFRLELPILENSIKNTLDVINATGKFATTLMNIPVTLKEKLDYSRDKLQSLETELETLTQKVRVLVSATPEEDMFDSENKTWHSFAGNNAGFGGWLRAGTGGPSIDGESQSDLAYRDIMIELIQARIETLKHWIWLKGGQ
jgi:hypothetical protein